MKTITDVTAAQLVDHARDQMSWNGDMPLLGIVQGWRHDFGSPSDVELEDYVITADGGSAPIFVAFDLTPQMCDAVETLLRSHKTKILNPTEAFLIHSYEGAPWIAGGLPYAKSTRGKTPRWVSVLLYPARQEQVA